MERGMDERKDGWKKEWIEKKNKKRLLPINTTFSIAVLNDALRLWMVAEFSSKFFSF